MYGSLFRGSPPALFQRGRVLIGCYVSSRRKWTQLTLKDCFKYWEKYFGKSFISTVKENNSSNKSANCHEIPDALKAE